MASLIISSLFLLVVTSAAAQTPTVASETPPAISAVATAMPTITAQAADAALATTGQSLCLPYLSEIQSMSCLMAGPAQSLAVLAQKEITFPPQPLTVVRPPLDLASVPFSYAKITDTTDPIPLYASVADAQANNVKETWPASKFKYVALNQKQVMSDGSVYYQIANEDWINANVISKVSATYFQGFIINQFPSVSFGWVLQSEIPSFTGPGGSSPKTGKVYNRLDLVRCYDSKIVNNLEWVMVGPDEWIQHLYLACVINNPTPPAGVTNGRWIEVNLYQQVMTVYDNSKMVFATLVGSGEPPFYTQPGTFKIYKKEEHDYMTGSFEADHSDFYYIEQVPFIMYYDGSRALHGAYWNNYLGYPGSHGCVNLSVADAHWLYNWAKEGDTVYVWDPSGKTPTDASLYGGGAF